MKTKKDCKNALRKAYVLLEPFSLKQKWEFDNELSHIEYVVNNFGQHTSILDAGCGIGLLGVSLSILGYKVRGLDKYVFKEWKEKDIEDLKRVWSNVGFIVDSSDIVSDQIHSQYDLVVSVAVFEHQPYPFLFMQSLLGIVKPGGMLYIATPNVSNGLNRFRMFFGKAPMGNIKPFFLEAEGFYGHWREYVLEELKTVGELLGLILVEAETVQTSFPRIRLKKWQTIHRALFQLLGFIIPGWGDTNRILWKK